MPFNLTIKGLLILCGPAWILVSVCMLLAGAGKSSFALGLVLATVIQLAKHHIQDMVLYFAVKQQAENEMIKGRLTVLIEKNAELESTLDSMFVQNDWLANELKKTKGAA